MENLELARQRLFGKSREFLARRSSDQDQTPLVENIQAAHAFSDTLGRLYAYADPTTEEFDTELSAVPTIEFTDQLFVALPFPRADGLTLPTVDELLALRIDASIMTVTVTGVREPSTAQPRRASAMITLQDYVRVPTANPHHRYEQALRQVQAEQTTNGQTERRA